MKKFLAMLLALTMVLSLSVTAFAADNEATADAKSENKATIDVTGKYKEGYVYADTVISVDVAWDSMEFVYASKGYEGEWNPIDHTYKNDNSGDWVKKTSDITVTNHSNAAVNANLTFTANVTTVNGSFDNATLALASAADGDSLGNKDKAPSAKSTFTISGTMTAEDEKLGTITVAISEQSKEKLEVALGYYYVEGDEVDWSNAKFRYTSADGVTTDIDGKTEGVEIKATGDSEEGTVNAWGTDYSYTRITYTVSYAGLTATFDVNCYKESAPMSLPATGDDSMGRTYDLKKQATDNE